MDQESKETMEAQFWRVYCEHVWNRVKCLANEACYGCSHRTPYMEDHRTCQLADEEMITMFMTKALECVKPGDVIQPWMQSCVALGFTLHQFTCFDSRWVIRQFCRSDRREILLGLMVDGEMITPAVNDDELLQAVTQMETQQEPDDHGVTTVVIDDDDDDNALQGQVDPVTFDVDKLLEDLM